MSDQQSPLMMQFIEEFRVGLTEMRSSMKDLTRSQQEHAVKTERLMERMDNVSRYIEEQRIIDGKVDDHEVRLKILENIKTIVVNNADRIEKLEHYRIRTAAYTLAVLIVGEFLFEIGKIIIARVL